MFAVRERGFREPAMRTLHVVYTDYFEACGEMLFCIYLAVVCGDRSGSRPIRYIYSSDHILPWKVQATATATATVRAIANGMLLRETGCTRLRRKKAFRCCSS